MQVGERRAIDDASRAIRPVLTGFPGFRIMRECAVELAYTASFSSLVGTCAGAWKNAYASHADGTREHAAHTPFRPRFSQFVARIRASANLALWLRAVWLH
ncbi:hypothetical protein [Massilia niastensis]|uniref:hypothetical protein n=1 Tax=Massilia niastensis TaxID=544911 RepID=UPI0012EBD309|nr:hypothetical protein [Massilia niastensis]